MKCGGKKREGEKLHRDVAASVGTQLHQKKKENRRGQRESSSAEQHISFIEGDERL